MADESARPNRSSMTAITDVDVDALAHCGSYLNLQDVSNMAMACKFFKRVAYSDSIWQRLFRDHWQLQMPSISNQTSGAREAFLGRHTALQQFKFVDPVVADFYTDAKPFDNLLLHNNDIIFSQGSVIQMMKINSFLSGRDSLVTRSGRNAGIALSGHNARITSMRLFSLNETSLFRSETESKENVLVTSSCDHSIRLWWKGSCQRCFRGHSGPVTSLSDKLLGDGNCKVLASGGEDCTVRLWSLSSSGKRGQHALKATLYGHEKPVKLMLVAGHKPSLLVTISKDSKVRVWDTTTSSAIRSSCCVGMTSVPGTPVNMKCHDSLLYVAAGSSVVAIDLRTMQKVVTAAIHQPKLHSFAIMPSKSLICTGGNAKAMLWDIRRSQETPKPQPISQLDGHIGPVTLLHMDPYKIVTGGPEDLCLIVWDVDTGKQTNSLNCCFPDGPNFHSGCSAMSVHGCRIVSASCGDELGLVRFRDFMNAACPVSKYEEEHSSKFWGAQSYSDSEDSDG